MNCHSLLSDRTCLSLMLKTRSHTDLLSGTEKGGALHSFEQFLPFLTFTSTARNSNREKSGIRFHDCNIPFDDTDCEIPFDDTDCEIPFDNTD